MTGKTAVVKQLDAIQTQLFGLVSPMGFRRNGRAFTRETEVGVVQTISLQAGKYEIGPPLPAPVAHWRPDLDGKFTINLGVFVQEIYNRMNAGSPKGVITDASCAIRTRLPRLCDGKDHWWDVEGNVAALIDEIGSGLLNVAIPWLNRFSTRSKIVESWIDYDENETHLSNVARLDVAMILLARGDADSARRLFQDQLKLPSLNIHHANYVRELSLKVGLGSLD